MWQDEVDERIYLEVVEGCLKDRDVSLHFGHREHVTAAAVRAAAADTAFIAAAFATTRTEYAAYRQAVHTEQLADEVLARAHTDLHIDRRLIACAGGLAAIACWFGVAWPTGLGFLSYEILPSLCAVTALLVLWAALSRPAVRSARSVIDLVVAVVRSWTAHSTMTERQQAWKRALTEKAMVVQMRDVVRSLLGQDPDSLLVAGAHDGLRDVLDPRYHVETRAERQLKQKMDQLDGGTIAVCGPRGAGKSTLLRVCSVQPSRALDLSVWMHAPADYAPQEFLLALFGEACARYLELVGARRDVGVFVRARTRRVRALLARVVTWTTRIALAVALLAVAGYLFARAYLASLRRGYERAVRSRNADEARRAWHWLRDHALVIWHHQPAFIACVLVALSLGLLRPLVPRFQRRTRQPRLVRDCQRYLFRLRTVQNSGAGLTLGLPAVQGLSLGASRSTSVTSVPFTFPELVNDFRELLAAIAAEQKENLGARVVIAIDELDRVGDAQQARRFLGQIKAVFGIENVYYLISVAEDVGAAFVRRGLPYRDVTDSSLDDLLYIPARDLAESTRLLALRAPDLTPPFVELIHALSGGIPRDLIRYARRVIEVHHWTRRFELRDLAPTIIRDELADTLEGFRTLLGMRDWTPESAPLLVSVYTLIRHLHEADGRSLSEVRRQISGLAANPSPLSAAGKPVLEGETLALWQEASVCCHFSVTLLDIFGAPGFDDRRGHATAAGADGHMQRLADARQELAVSPHSARLLLNTIRQAWSLPAS